MNFILLFVVISFIFVVFDLHRFAFVLELLASIIFIFLLVFGMFIIYHNGPFGWTILGATLILLLVDTFFIFFLTKKFETPYMTIIFFSIIGLIVTLLNFREGSQKSAESILEEQEKVRDYYPYIDKMEPQRVETTKEEQEAKIY